MPLLVSGLSQNERQREGAEQVVEMPPLSCSARCYAFRAAQRLSVFGDLRKIIGSGDEKRGAGQLTASLCAHPDGLKTPWLDGAVFNAA